MSPGEDIPYPHNYYRQAGCNNALCLYHRPDRRMTTCIGHPNFIGSCLQSKKIPAEFSCELIPLGGMRIIFTAAPDQFLELTLGSSKLGEILKREEDNSEEIELIGLCTEICAVSNAILIKAFLQEKKISVDLCCYAGITPEKHQAAL